MPRSKAALSKAFSGRNACIQEILVAVMVAAAAATINYAISGPEYHHVAPRGTDGYYLIRSLNLTKGGPLGHLILQCNKKCLANDSCTSFVVNSKLGTCNLTILNRCKSRPNALDFAEDYFFFERYDSSTPYPPTCYVSCMIREAYDCNKCGRPNCWGDQCEQCATTCWKRIDKTENITKFLMDDQRFTSKLSCNGNWQLWWGKGIKVAKPTPEEALVLHLNLVYTDGRELSSYFDSVVFEESGKLSVGNLTIDKGAGNWWQAPFSSRPLRRPYNSNCRPFYIPNDTCVSHTTESVEEQRELYNGTVLYLGYAWLTSEQSYDNVPILHINMWVKCAQCED